jgi:hypothetical protein
VRLDFSSRVIWETRETALVYAADQVSEPGMGAENGQRCLKLI